MRRMIVPWYGSKAEMAPRIAQELGPHDCYVDLFAGSFAVLLGKKPCEREFANDLHGDLINLARVLRDRAKALDLYERANRTLFYGGFMQEADKYLQTHKVPKEPDVLRAYWYLVSSWFHFWGFSGTHNLAGKNYTRESVNSHSTAREWGRALESIPAWHRRLKSVNIRKGDAFNLLKKLDDRKGVAIYADPPYEVGTRSSVRYIHEFDWKAHKRLAKALTAFKKVRVVVSYYDDPKLRRLYAGWTVVTCTKMKTCSRRPGVANVVGKEILLLNGPSLTSEYNLWR